jgi:hypothetical protein
MAKDCLEVIVCRCGARESHDEQFCDYCCFMQEEPGAYWDKDIGWCFKLPLRSNSSNA